MGKLFTFTDVFIVFIILIISILLLIKYTIYVRKRNAQRKKAKYLNIKRNSDWCIRKEKEGVYFFITISIIMCIIFIYNRLTGNLPNIVYILR